MALCHRKVPDPMSVNRRLRTASTPSLASWTRKSVSSLASVGKVTINRTTLCRVSAPNLRHFDGLCALLTTRLAQQAFRREGRRRIVMLVGKDGWRVSFVGTHDCSVPVRVSMGLAAPKTRKAAPSVVQRPSHGSIGAMTLAAQSNGG